MNKKTRSNRTSHAHYDSYRNFNDNYYNRTSNAYKYNNQAYEREIVTEKYRKKPVTKRIKTKKFSKPQFVFLQNEFIGLSLAAKALLLVFFLGCVGLVFSSSLVSNKKVSISKLQREIKKIEESNDAMQAENASFYNLKKIEEIATTKLNMHKPKPYQIVYLNVTKQQPVVTHITVEKENMVNKIINFFGKG